MTDHDKPLALVTGASSGIGLELAKQFADHGYDLVINAEDSTINTVAEQLRSSGIDVRAVQADLRSPEAIDRLWSEATAERDVDVAVLNAGVGEGGAFIDTDLADELEIIDVNIVSTVRLAKKVLSDMADRNDGKLLITSSIASTMPGSYQAVYNASKSFLQSFAQAVQNELNDTDVTITALMPGPTDTNFFHRAEMDDTSIGQQSKDDPAQVAKQGFDALMAGKDKIIAGSVKTKAEGHLGKVLPDSAKAAMHSSMAKPND